MLENTEGGNQKWTIQRNWQHRAHNTKKNNTIYVGHHYMQTNTNNVNKTSAFLQTTGGKEEPNIVFIRTSQLYIIIHIFLIGIPFIKLADL